MREGFSNPDGQTNKQTWPIIDIDIRGVVSAASI